METRRKNIVRDNRPIKLIYDNMTLIGHSRLTLHKGDCFLYHEHHTDGTKCKRFARCHGRVKPNDSDQWLILAQVANDMMSFTFERWVDPKDIFETLPNDKIKPGIKQFFEHQIELNGY